jgi:glycosyltransferase involved in cell wall biosynthesis
MRPVPSSMPRRLRLLHAIHDFLPRHQAGSEIYATTLCQALLRRGHHVTILAADFDPARRHGELTWRVFEGLPVVEIVNNWQFASFEETYRAPSLLPVLDHVLRATQPDVLHVHSLLNLSFDLPRQARARGARVVGTLHDYTLVCASGGQRVHRAERHVCHTIEADRCARCFSESAYPGQMAFGRALGRPGGSFARRLGATLRRRAPRLLAHLAKSPSLAAGQRAPTGAAIEERLNAARAAVSEFDLLIAPSRSIAAEFKALGVAPGRLDVADYGFRPLPVSGSTSSTSADTGRLRVGYVGTLVWHKGVHVLIDAIRQMPPGQADVSIFGDPETFPDYTAELRASARGLPVRFMGRFARECVADIYSQLDVLVVPSVWLENSPLVIHEAFMAGVPVIGARIGGITDLVRDGENGLLYPPESSSALAAALSGLATDRSRLPALRARATPVRSIDDDAIEWERRYLSLSTSEGPNRRVS